MTAMQSVVTPQAPIRAAPAHAASLDTEALFGETVIASRSENGFSHVVLATDGYAGWMPSDCLGVMPEATHEFIASHSFVTATADVKSLEFSHLSLGAKLHLRQPDAVGHCAAFAEIDFNGTSGFVPHAHIVPLGAGCDDWVTRPTRP